MANPVPPNPYAPPGARVDDVPDPSGETEIAGRGARLGASIIDGIIIAALVIPVWVWGLGKSIAEPMPLVDTVLYLALAYGAYFVINATLLARSGQSVGKRLLNIRIVRSDGSRAGLLRLFGLRYAINNATLVTPVAGWIYALVDSLAIFGRNRRCVHDYLADTIVIKA